MIICMVVGVGVSVSVSVSVCMCVCVYTHTHTHTHTHIHTYIHTYISNRARRPWSAPSLRRSAGARGAGGGSRVGRGAVIWWTAPR